MLCTDTFKYNISILFIICVTMCSYEAESVCYCVAIIITFFNSTQAMHNF